MYNAMMNKTEVQISGTSFFIAPFPVFVSVRITAMLTKVLSPVLGGLVALLGSGNNEEGTSESDAMEEAAAAIPTFTDAMSSLNPYDFEKLMRELLITSRTIVWKNDQQPDGEILIEESLNALMAGNSQDVYILAYHVLKVNFKGFFEKFKSLSGNPTVKALLKKAELTGTEDSISPDLRILN